MISYFRYSIKRDKLLRDKIKSREKHNNKLKEARKKIFTKEQIQSIQADEYSDYKCYEEELNVLITEYLKSQAKKYFIELPPYNDKDMWDDSQTFMPELVLTSKGITYVKSLIRNEQKELLDSTYKIVGISIGLIGAITGLLAVILK